MILSGRLADWSVEELLQIMRITHKTGSIMIETVGADVVLFFDDGALVDARSHGRADGGDSQVRIVEAIASILDAPDGTFDIGAERSATAGEPIPVPDLLSAVAIWRAAEEELRASGVLDATAIRLVHDVDGPMLVDPDAWLAIAEFAGTLTFTELEIRLGRIGAIEVVRSLRDMGALEMTAAVPAGGGMTTRAGSPDSPPRANAPPPTPLEGDDEDDGIGDDDDLEETPLDHLSEPPPEESQEPEHDEVEMAGDEAAGSRVDGRRREMRSVITPAETTLVPGVLSDIRTRFRQ